MLSDTYVRITTNNPLTEKEELLLSLIINESCHSNILFEDSTDIFEAVIYETSEGHSFEVALQHDLTDSELETICEMLDRLFSDYDIEASGSSQLDENHSLQLGQQIAIAEHNRWVDKMVGEGWRWGPKLNISERTHPMIQAWEQLPEKYQQAQHPNQWIKTLEKLGYKVTKT